MSRLFSHPDESPISHGTPIVYTSLVGPGPMDPGGRLVPNWRDTGGESGQGNKIESVYIYIYIYIQLRPCRRPPIGEHIYIYIFPNPRGPKSINIFFFILYGSWRPGSMWKSFLREVGFILTKYEPISIHGDPVYIGCCSKFAPS